MEPPWAHHGFDIGSAAFWLFIAACVVVGHWAKTRREAEKHETLRRIIEKTGVVDEARLKELFKPTPASDWSDPASLGAGYRGLRVGGTIVMFIASGLAVCFLILGQTHTVGRDPMVIGLAVAAVVALLGAGLFFASRFVRPPPNGSRDETSAR